MVCLYWGNMLITFCVVASMTLRILGLGGCGVLRQEDWEFEPTVSYE